LILRSNTLLLCLCFSQTLWAQSRESYFNAIDANGNGQVSLNEFQEWMSYAFVRIDQNHNDVIDEDEALVPKMRGVTRARHRANIAAQFHRQDVNRNGSLSMTELTAPPR
jgi:Ca2+-binding EF-hand superfamily protein